MATRCMCSALRMAARRLTQLYDAHLAAAGLSTAQFSLLNTLDQCATSPSVNDLAERMGLDRTTLAHNLRPLERDGLVSVAVDAEDRRARRIALTADGQARRLRAEPLWGRAQAEFEAAYGQDRAAALQAALLAIPHGVRTEAGLATRGSDHAC